MIVIYMLLPSGVVFVVVFFIQSLWKKNKINKLYFREIIKKVIPLSQFSPQN